jgi:hypothetical protein
MGSVGQGATQKSLPIVICADAVRALFPTPRRQLVITIKAAAICSSFFLLGTSTGMEWIGLIGIALCGWLFVVPPVLGINRLIGSLPCSACGLPAGGHTTVNLILHLQCNHCGHLSRTDCLMLGQPPTKI